MKLAFITVNFHSDDDTFQVVTSLEKNKLPTGLDLTIYVVDNSQSDDLKKRLEECPHAIYIESPGNLGFAAGNNLGFKQAITDEIDYIVLINNDTLISSDLITSILRSPIVDDEVGLVGGLIYFAKGYEFETKYEKSDLGKVIWYAGGKYDWNNVYASHVGVNQVDKGQFSKTKPTDFITGCLFITKREVIQKVGLFDERYCLYFEDSDLGLRIKKAGYQLMFDPRIIIWHKVAQSSGIGSPLNDYFLTRNRLLFGMTYASFRTKFALFREALKKSLLGTPSQKIAVRDFFIRRFGWGSWNKKVLVPGKQ